MGTTPRRGRRRCVGGHNLASPTSPVPTVSVPSTPKSCRSSTPKSRRWRKTMGSAGSTATTPSKTPPPPPLVSETPTKEVTLDVEELKQKGLFRVGDDGKLKLV